MAQLVIHRDRDFAGLDYFLQIDDEKYRIKRGETKTLDLPTGNHTLTVKSDNINRVAFPVDIQHDNDVKHLKIKEGIPRWYSFVLFGLLFLAIVLLFLVVFNVLERKAMFFYGIFFLAGTIMNIYIAFKYKGKNIIVYEI